MAAAAAVVVAAAMAVALAPHLPSRSIPGDCGGAGGCPGGGFRRSSDSK